MKKDGLSRCPNEREHLLSFGKRIMIQAKRTSGMVMSFSRFKSDRKTSKFYPRHWLRYVITLNY